MVLNVKVVTVCGEGVIKPQKCTRRGLQWRKEFVTLELAGPEDVLDHILKDPTPHWHVGNRFYRAKSHDTVG